MESETLEDPFISLCDAAHWVAFGRPAPPRDERSVDAFNCAERHLITSLASGDLKAWGAKDGGAELEQIPITFWAEAEVDWLASRACDDWMKKGIAPRRSWRWQRIKLRRADVLSYWPDPIDGVARGERRIGTEPAAKNYVREYLKKAQEGNIRPSLDALQTQAKKDGVVGGRKMLRAAYVNIMGAPRRGRPKSPEKIAKK